MSPQERHRQRQQHRRSRRRLVASAFLMQRRGKRYLPPLVRGLAGLVLVLLGIVGFLPILGFWMIPLGLALLATDIPPASRWLRRRLFAYRRRHRHQD